MAGADIAVHAAALKQVTVAEYNPFEVVKTNILGSQNVVDAALDSKISKAILISSDKAVHPVNLYGATKMVAEKFLFREISIAESKNYLFCLQVRQCSRKPRVSCTFIP